MAKLILEHSDSEGVSTHITMCNKETKKSSHERRKSIGGGSSPLSRNHSNPIRPQMSTPALVTAPTSLVPDQFGYSPLHSCSAFGHLDILTLLLEKLSKDMIKTMININNERRGESIGDVESPYHLAALNGHAKVLKAIIDYVCSVSS